MDTQKHLSNLEIAIRKNVEFNKVQYWLLINAKSIQESALDTLSAKETFKPKKKNFTSKFLTAFRWSMFMNAIIMMNTILSINYILYENPNWFFWVATIAHGISLIYFIDFGIAVIHKVAIRKQKSGTKTRKTSHLVLDALSLLPLSLGYVIVKDKPDPQTFWILRSITLLRFYRIPVFINEIATPGRKFYTIFILACILYLFISIDIFANILYVYYDNDIQTVGWNKTSVHKLAFFFYHSTATFLNVGFGTVKIESYWEKVITSIAVFAGNTIVAGIITGTMAIEMASRDRKRETFRHEYVATKRNLKELNIEKKMLEKISQNMQALWKYKIGQIGVTLNQILPVALLKEVLFDINYGLLNRSLIFSKQPRPFLRSVVFHMKNMSYLAGDIITEPFGMAEGMICIISGVVEILSEENDETPLISFTNGTILGEAALFISIPNRCVIRAATYVELQILLKVNFAKVAIRYPGIYRAMQAQVFKRLEFKEVEKPLKLIETDFFDSASKKVVKRLIQELKRQKKEEPKMANKEKGSEEKENFLRLYVWSENIPRVKILPTNLVQGKSWILRPHSFLMKIWELWMLVVINCVAYGHPYLAVFEGRISPFTFMFLIVTDIFYVLDLMILCITAVERKDNFTYITSIKEIIQYRLTTVSFYFDIFSAYNFNIYSNLIYPQNPEFAYLLLSLNRLMKWWKMVHFIKRQEENLNRNFQMVVTLKYIYYFTVLVWWLCALLYFEACPMNKCIQERWYAQLKVREEIEEHNEDITQWPPLVALYWASVIIYGVGYGDIQLTAITDCLAVTISVIVGAILFSFTEANASASMRHLARSRTNYQEEIFAVDRFMEEHDLPEDIKQRVKNYFRLQWNYDQAFILQQDNVLAGRLGLQKSIILNQMMKKFLAVPIFRFVGDDFLKIITKSSKMIVLPPDEMITEAGSFVRETYILESGYCEISTNDPSGEVRVIGPVNSFGFIEMILGTAMEINVRTITHARILFLDYFAYMRAVTKYPSVKEQIDNTFEKNYKTSARKKWDNLGYQPLDERESTRLKRDAKFFKKPMLNIYKHHRHGRGKHGDYWKPFESWGKFRMFQIFLLPFVIPPNSIILKIWMTLRIINVFIIGLLAPVHYSIPNTTEGLHGLIMFSLSLTYLDIYLMFHVAYYNENGLLIYHPSKTALHYFKGSFLLDLFTAIPIHIFFSGEKIDESTLFFYNSSNLIIVLQFYKIWQACYFLESDILKKTEVIKILKFIPLTIVVTNLITGITLIVECSNNYTPENIPYKNSDKITLRKQFVIGLIQYCPNHANYTFENVISPLKFYTIGFYWVTYTMTQIGFGDVYDHSFRGMVVVIFIVVLGVFLYAYMFASLTGAMLSLHNVIAIHRTMLLEMIYFMRKNKVSEKTQKQIILHYKYTWVRTEGTKPQNMFTLVHTALREKILTRMYEATIRQVPAFSQIDTPLIRLIGRHLDEIYFLLGETIVNYHDTLEYIYLIYRGKVDVVSQGGEFITSLGSGGLFGNISNKTHCLSSEIMIAASNVDILRVDSANFFKALQVFPKARSLLDYLYSQKSDYIEPLGQSSVLNFEEGTSETDTVPYEMVGLKTIRPELKFGSDESLDHKRNFHLRGAVYAKPQRRCLSWVIFPTSTLFKVIDLTTVFLTYWSFVLTIYMFAYQDFALPLIAASYIMDFFFYIRFFLEFRFSYFNKYGDLVVSTKLIRRRYFKSKTTVIIDILGNLPLDAGAFIANETWLFKSLSILRLNKLVRFRYILEFFNVKFKVLMVNKVLLQLSFVVIIITLMIHVLSCLWFFAVSPLGYVQKDTWLTKLGLEHAEKWQCYIMASYYICILCTTTGFGDTPIYTTPELGLAIFFTIFSHFALAWTAGVMANMAGTQGSSLFSYQERITDLKMSLIRQNISEHQLAKMWHYVTALWNRDFGKQIPDLITLAPHAMKCDLMYEMFGRHLAQSYPFSQTEEAFLRQLAACLKRNIFFPGNYIVQQGDTDRTMYFINKGEVYVLTIRADLMETIHFKLTQNDHFGMSQGLILERPHAFSYRAITEVEILSLNLSQWEHLFRYFPRAKEKVYDRLYSLLPEAAESGGGLR